MTSSVRFTASTSTNGVVERDFQVGDVPAVLWSAENAADAPLVLMGHGGGLHKKTPALKARAIDTVTTWGYSVVAIDAPGHGDRPRTAFDEQARDEMQRTRQAGDDEGFAAAGVRYMDAIAERAVPEWQATLDALDLAPAGYGGGVSMGTAIGIRLTAADPRIRAAVFGGGFFLSDPVLEAARRITVPIQFLLPWDDRYVDRQSMLTLFDAFASTDKTLHANPGDHRTVRWIGLDQTFLHRHLG